jgi:hypothetical protein
MAGRRSTEFLPRVFQTDTNERFLGATLDHLITDSVNIPLNGYIGRTFAPTYKLGDNYVPENTNTRQNYQLEPSVVITDDSNNVLFNTGFQDLLYSIQLNGGSINDQQRLFSSKIYNFDGHFDYDKFVNYFNYYWLPNGPVAVQVFGGQADFNAEYTVTRNTAVGGYTFSGKGNQPNTQLTLVRGGTYRFKLDQPDIQFWIQSKPGTSGVDPNLATVSTRDVFGVSNNGEDVGTVTFRVPLSGAQDFFNAMPIVSSVDAAVTFKYTDIQNRLESDFLNEFPDGLDGINNQLQDKTIIFIGNDIASEFWTTPGLDTGAYPYASIYDALSLTPGQVVATSARPSPWKISRVPIDSEGTDYVLQLLPVTPESGAIGARKKIFVQSGKTYASLQFWLNDNLRYDQVPAITANLPYLFYQDSANNNFVGQIKLIDNVSTPVNVSTDILGQVGYTSPNGVIFTNGLKIQFDDLVTPATYANQEYYVEGVGTAINLVPVTETVIPESWSEDILTTADYITINRGSQDRNSWSRSNRWFHTDVIHATARYNNTTADYGPNLPGRRPIIEFEPNLQLFNHGRLAKNNVDLIVLTATDAFGVTLPDTRVQGQDALGPQTVIDGVQLLDGHRIVFADDYDLNVKNKIWRVQVLTELDDDPEYPNGYLTLVEDTDSPVLPNENVMVTSGDSAGDTFRFDGNNWFLCQRKTGLNQDPLYDIVDNNGYSFSDTTVYPNSTFVGNKVFAYLRGTGTNNDPILGFPLQYQNFNNIGDIVFKNFYSHDTFTYTTNIDTGTTANINTGTGYLAKRDGITDGALVNIWAENLEPSSQFQIFTKFFDGRVLEFDGVERPFVQIDILPTDTATIPHFKVFLNNQLLLENINYALTTYGQYNVVVLYSSVAVGDKIDVAVFGPSVGQIGSYYEIPKNLEFNPLNQNFENIALGQIRTHYSKLVENTAPSNRPLQDSYLKAQGGTLVQHSSPLIYSMTFLNDPLVNFTNGLDYAKKEYNKFKNKFLNLCMTLPGINYNDAIGGVDLILQNINAVKNSSFPWYYSDMVPQGGNYTTLTYTVLNRRQTNYEINSIFDNTKLGNRAVLIWLNGNQLTLGKDYVFSPSVPAVIFSRQLEVNDEIIIRDYFDTDGNYIPETPSKLGMYPKSEPTIYLDTTYQDPINVIRGHDGSLTPAFGDFRDQFLLELELRVYNNIKSDYSKNAINLYDIVPGRFRNTEYSLTEFNRALGRSFLQWAGINNVDYTTNRWYDVYNPWTYNYERYTSIVDDKPMPGSWRAIYQYWYDTDQPNLAPWQMLGFGFKPDWWDSRYGSAPYTSGNFTLWEDLEAGYVWNNGDPYVDQRFARPGLTSFIPVDSAGNLLNPTEISFIQQTNPNTASSSFKVGQLGPVEVAWRRSSDYPFAVQTALSILKPALYFGTQFDTSRFFINSVTDQFSDQDNQKITPTRLKVNGDTTTGTILRTSGYINWIADGIKSTGIDPVKKINSYLKNWEVKLNYKIGGFVDKRLITVTAEQSAPSTTRGGVIIPDNNYTVYLDKSVPISTATYSAVIVQKVSNGYTISGYNTKNPYFTILPSLSNNNAESVTILDKTVKLYNNSQRSLALIQYGTIFSNIQQVSDFIISYQRYLETLGFVFDYFDPDLQETRNFRTSVKEFVTWSQQGWADGTIIVLNPAANRLVLRTSGTVVDEINNTANGSRILDQNFLPIKNNVFNVVRKENAATGNEFSVTTLNGSIICFANLNLMRYEHVLIFDNTSDFGDIVYVPDQGLRQFRLKLSGSKTGDWTGALSAAGYVYNNTIIEDWQSGRDYLVGDIVNFNNNYYTALKSIPASERFDITSWSVIDKTQLKTGLLPSFGLQAQQFDSIYDIDKPPADENVQLFSSGLIGFRPRSYLTDLGLNVTNQTKFYQGFIREKGSLNSITALTKASFNNVKGEIKTYEEWGFRVGQYGDIDGNQYKEFILDQSVFVTNPVAFTITDNYTNGNIIANLMVSANLMTSNVYNASDLSNTNTQIYSNRSKDWYASDLPKAGYVHLDDADLTIFDINQYSDVPQVGIGDVIWTAKDTAGGWNIYRVCETELKAIQLTYVSDNFGQFLFNQKHQLNPGDLFIVKNFNVEYFDNVVLKVFSSNYDGIYKVVDVINDLSIIVEIQKNLNNLIATSPVVSNAETYKLVSSRVEYIDQLTDLTPLQSWINGDRVWVNNATASYGWGVYRFAKNWPSALANTIQANTATGGDQFGIAITWSNNKDRFYVYNPGQNHLQMFSNVDYTFSPNIVISNADSKFGSAMDTQGNLLAIASTNYLGIYRFNDYRTPQEPSFGFKLFAHDNYGLAWTPNTVIANASLINYSGNAYTTIGNVFGNTFVNANVQANLVAANVIPVNSLLTYANVSYITLGNIYTANLADLTFTSISANTRQIDRTVGNITLTQTIALGNLVGNVSSVVFSNNQDRIFVGGNNQIRTYYTNNADRANIWYTLSNVITGSSGFGNIVRIDDQGTKLITSGPTATVGGYTEAGAVYVYTRTANALALTDSISSSAKNNSALFGSSFDADSTLANLFVGSPKSSLSGFTNGLVEYFQTVSGSYVHQGNILHPAQQSGNFGTTISCTSDAKTLAVGSRGSSAEESIVFDNNETLIDTGSTTFIDTILESGTVYMFEPLYNLANSTTLSYTFTQELESGPDIFVSTGDNFGQSIALDPTLMLIGAPGTNGSAGLIHTFFNYDQDTAWTQIRSKDNQVDINSVNRTFLYNKNNNNILATIDVVDPAKGKILTTIDQDIDYKREEDPAIYNAGTGSVHQNNWGPDQVGRIWWDLSAIRYLDYEQDALIYRLNHWGNTFPGSEVRVYEWVESTVLPSQFVNIGDSGTPLYPDDSRYSTYGYVDQSGTVRLKYYFWVTNRDLVNERKGKRHSVVAIISAIESPQNQNIPYATILRNDTLALYNIKNLLQGNGTVLHLGSRSETAGLIHTEYALVQEKSASSVIPHNILAKIIDSLSGADRAENVVPDPDLPASQRYGIMIRPRQTMFVSRNNALNNYLALVNAKLAAYPVTQRKILTTLLSGEPEPSSLRNIHNLVVDSKAELDYIDTDTIVDNFCVLVQSDVTNRGKWAIYQWNEMDQEWMIHTRDDGTDWIQSYKTDLYWTYQDWYAEDYNPSRAADITVNNNLDFGKLTLQPNTYIKVLNAGNDKFAIYYIDENLERQTVGLESGTIQISTDTIPGKELRQILLAMQNEIFIDDLAQDFNEIFFAMVKYALTEQKNLDWAFKTSFISATQYIRKLEQFSSYIIDNQDFYQDYINEVKPYRTILREFNINYQRDDRYDGNVTDFDLDPYWDANVDLYRSPSGEQSYDAQLINNVEYQDWKNNYTYRVVDVVVGAVGSGYVTAPQIIISGGGGTGANAVAQINGFGQLANITVVSPGLGYISSPTVTINGTGTGAIATAVLRNVFDGNDAGHNVVRSIRTQMKFDRVTYANAEIHGNQSNVFVSWDSITATANIGETIVANAIIRLGSDLYKLVNAYVITGNTITNTVDFPSANVVSINANIFDNANDRIRAYNGNVDLAQDIDGLGYPGVMVDGSTYFAYNTITEWEPNIALSNGSTFKYQGNVYVVGIWNANVSAYEFGNTYANSFSYVSNVNPVSAQKIDTIISSRYSDNLGLEAGNIFVDGGNYIDVFSSHAPQELVPGHMRDSLNIQVFGANVNVNPYTSEYAFRVFDNMSGRHEFKRIADSATTTLAEDLEIADDIMVVTDASVLPKPNGELGHPGIVFVNGEKIYYGRNYAQETVAPWTSNTSTIAVDSLINFDGNIYLVLGNVFASNVAWQPNTVFASNTFVFYSGASYRINGNVNAPLFSNIVANTTLIYNNENSGFATIQSNVRLIGSNVNILSQLRRAVDGTAPNSLNITPWTTNLTIGVGSYVSYLGNTYVTTGDVFGFDRAWRANVVFGANTHFRHIGNVYVTTGNVYGTSFANVVGNTTLVYTNRIDSGFASIEANLTYLYTGTDNVRHLANSKVVDASLNQTIPDYETFTSDLLAGNVYTVTANVSYKLRLNNNITANLGDFIVSNTANLRVLESVTSKSNIAVIRINGNIQLMSGNTVSIRSVATGNLTITNANVISTAVLGTVNSLGNVIIAANTIRTTGNVWHSNVTGGKGYGNTLTNSTTTQAIFLKAQPGGYTP